MLYKEQISKKKNMKENVEKHASGRVKSCF